MKRHFTGLLLLVVVSGCSDEPGAAASHPKEEKPHHPWNWQPDDPELAHGRDVYSKTCGLCHNEGEQGAPSLSNAARWKARLTKGPETLVRNAIHGFKGDDGKMPPRGDNDALTDADVTAAVKFMLASLNRLTP